MSRLRAFEKETGRKKRQLVIASSANFSSSDLVDLIGDDMFDVIPKPVMISDLKRVMVEYHFDLRL